jgi:hypothetical protein
MRLVQITSGDGYADHDPACGRRSDHDLRTQLRWRARTQLTALLAPPTALMPAHGPTEEFGFVLMDGIWNGIQYNQKQDRYLARPVAATKLVLVTRVA